ADDFGESILNLHFRNRPQRLQRPLGPQWRHCSDSIKAIDRVGMDLKLGEPVSSDRRLRPIEGWYWISDHIWDGLNQPVTHIGNKPEHEQRLLTRQFAP